jgi:alpha/beta superfamily hydrolase
MNKIIYIIPGFTEQVNVDIKIYQPVIKICKANGFTPVPIMITWKNHIMDDYVHECLQQIKNKQQNTTNKKNQIYLFGFSFGAMIACIISTQIKPKAQILCSLSPYFSEDIPNIKKSWLKIIGKHREADFKKLYFAKLLPEIDCQTILLVGSKESKNIHKRVTDAHTKIKHNQLILVHGAKHDIADKNYIQEIQKIIQLLK